MTSLRILLATALIVGAASQLTCTVNDYCLQCHKGDGGPGDGVVGDGSGGDASDASTCVPTGTEICDGKDNDCDGLIDEGTLPGVGDLCPNQLGVCAGGVEQCTPTSPGDSTTDKLNCTKKPSPEVCNGLDDDCDGVVDNGDPGGGGRCGNGVGTCIQGTNHCISGAVQCIGAVGPVAEICDGKDNDCDGTIDEGLTNLGSCGVKTCVGSSNAGATCTLASDCPGGTCQANVGVCKLGVLACQGGTTVCTGAVTQQFEVCDGLDNDCDGVVDEGFNLQTDPNNCGTCNHVCSLPNAVAGCSAGGCVIASCKAGYHDNDGIAANGCEFGPCFTSGAEVCDGVDNDCDGVIDETPAIGTPPAICATQGECAGTVAACPCANTPDAVGCASPSGWKCTYGATVSTDANGNIVAETLCDGKDNDCNGIIDDHQPQMAHADGTALVPVTCNDGKAGACRGTGAYTCDNSNPPTSLNGPAVCTITTPGAAPMPEQCNNIDDDCDGLVDEGANTGNLPGQNWINIGDGKQMMQYEASKPDASAAAGGNVTTATCSQSGVLPWTNVTYPAAVAACQAIGATLCSEQQWQRSCSVITPTTYPIAVSGSPGTRIEAEDYSGIAFATDNGSGCSPTPCPTTHSWKEDKTGAFSGMSAMIASPATPTVTVTIGNATANSPRLDFLVNFTAIATYHVFVRMWAPSGAGNAKTIYLGVNPTAPPTPPTNTLTTSANNDTWQWVDSGAISVPALGNHYVSLYMGTDGVRVDELQIQIGTTTPAPMNNLAGNTWAYASMPNVYQPTTCNGIDYHQVTISTVSRAGNVVTVTTASPHGFAVGDTVQIANVVDSSFDGYFIIASAPTTTTFTYSESGANGSSTGGAAIDQTASSALATGTLAGCYANLTTTDHAFDLSGNVKEWVTAHQPGENPIRGGSYNNTSVGTSCPLDFTLADDTFFFPNVGFRCCR